MNKNKKMVQILTLGVFIFGMILFSNLKAHAGEDGLAVFKKYKCNACHAISSLNVKVEEDKESKEEVEQGDDKRDPPDLSGEGLIKEHDAGWIRKFLRKTVKLNDKKHLKIFKGEKEELDVLVAWLTTLNTKVEQKAKKDKK